MCQIIDNSEAGQKKGQLCKKKVRFPVKNMQITNRGRRRNEFVEYSISIIDDIL